MKVSSETRLFLLSFSASFFLIALLFLFMTAVIHPGTPPSLQADAPAEEEYLPDAGDALTLLLIGAEAPDLPAGSFLLLRFDPVGEQVLVTSLPPETVLGSDDSAETLYDAYRFGGAKYTMGKLESFLTLPIDRYARITLNSFILSAGAVGTVEFELAQALTLMEGEVAVTLQQGVQLLDGRKIAALIRDEALSSPERCALTESLVCAVINQRIDVVRSTLIDKIFETVINLVDSNISYADYEVRKAAALQLSNSEHEVAKRLTLSGTWREERFYLHDTSIAMLLRNYL